MSALGRTGAAPGPRCGPGGMASTPGCADTMKAPPRRGLHGVTTTGVGRYWVVMVTVYIQTGWFGLLVAELDGTLAMRSTLARPEVTLPKLE
jgi:hypothetical protein